MYVSGFFAVKIHLLTSGGASEAFVEQWPLWSSYGTALSSPLRPAHAYVSLCPVVPSPVRPRYQRYGCGCVDALIGLMQGKSSALSGQPQMAEPLPIHALSDKPTPALSGQPMLMSRSLSGCAPSGQTSLSKVRMWLR
jgi:hypothetical protein